MQTIANIQRELLERPQELRSEPFNVPPEAYVQARAEMSELLRDRGWPLPSADIGRENFLLMGVPVCPNGEG